MTFGLCLLAVCFLLTGGFAGSQTKAPKNTKLRVLVPTKGARVLINGVRVKGAGKERLIAAPPLAKGKEHYKITASWRTNNYTKFFRSRNVSAKTGETVLVDLRKADPKIPDHIKIRFVPTPDDVVARMCKLAGVGKNDVVYDLGCGDGRIVMTAVADFSAKRGVGIDLNPKLVKKCRKEADKRGLKDRVTFRVGDVLKVTDLSSASVVMLYMGEDVNMRLRPILRKTLKAGSRIVSHDFGMGDWQPDRTDIFEGDDGNEYTLYMWTIK